MQIMRVSPSPDRSSESGRHPRLVPIANRLQWLLLLVLIAASLIAVPAYSAVTLRVDARPVSAPISALVTVTDANGVLAAADFSVFVDGVAVASPNFSLPPAQDINQHVSIVFAMDYSSSVQTAALAPMQAAVIAFINSMKPGDYAAIIKFNNTNPSRASVVQPFTRIDGAAGTAALIDAVNAPYPGAGTNIYDAVLLAVQQFTAPPTALPSGPKAIILISDGRENSSNADVNTAVSAANDAKIPVFTVGVGDFTGATSQQILTGLASQTSGEFYPAPTDTEIAAAYLQVSQLLINEYLLTFQSNIVDCNPHTLEVQVTGQAASATATFTRCTPILAPDVRGLTLAQATTELTNLGLVVGTVTERASTTVPVGSVVSQNPTVGTVVNLASTVNLVLSSGPPPATVPNVVGMTRSVAGDTLRSASLVVGTVTQQSSTTVASGSVISQSPSGATVVTAGAAVDLVVSNGPPPKSGGGGATGPFELVAGLLLLAAMRRRRGT